MPLSLPGLGVGPARIVAGSGAPPADVVTDVVVPANGWLIVAPQ